MLLSLLAPAFLASTPPYFLRDGISQSSIGNRMANRNTPTSRGADATSADIPPEVNKLVRSAYGGVSIHQDLSLESIEAWNEGLSSGRSAPPGMKKGHRVFVPNGNPITTDRQSRRRHLRICSRRQWLVQGRIPRDEIYESRPTGRWQRAECRHPTAPAPHTVAPEQALSSIRRFLDEHHSRRGAGRSWDGHDSHVLVPRYV